MRELLKYKMEFFFLLLGFFIASVAFNYSMNVYIEQENEENDIIENEYKYGASLCVTPQGGSTFSKDAFLEDICNFIAQIEAPEGCCISIVDIAPYVDETFANCLASIHLSGDMPKYELVKGCYPSESMYANGEKYVVLGIKKKSDTYSKNGKDYIKIQGEEYCVSGYISTKTSKILDNDIILFQENLGEKITESLYYYYISGTLIINFQSDTKSDIYEWLNETITMFDDEKYSINISPNAYQRVYSTSVGNPEYKQYADVIFVFCIILCVFVIEYCIVRRNEELVIRKIYGYTNFSLVKMFAEGILGTIIIAIFLSEVFLTVMNYIDVGLFVFNLQEVYYRFVISVVYGLLTFIITSTYTFIELCIKRPIKLIGKNSMN